MSFKSYLATRRVTRHPNGHFVLDARADRDFPDVENWPAIRDYLHENGAFVDAIKAGYAVWRGYRRRVRERVAAASKQQ